MALVAAGRLLLIGLRSVPARAIAAVTAPLARVPALLAPFGGYAIAAGIVFAFVLPFLPFANRYVVDIGTTVLIYIMLGWGLNIVVGLAGLLDLGYVAFYAVGAYSYALFAQWFDLGFWECLPIAGVLAATLRRAAGLPGAAPARRLSGDRDARLRRDHPHHPAQLVPGDPRPGRPLQHPAPDLLRPRVRPLAARGRDRLPRVLRPQLLGLPPGRPSCIS